MTRGLCAILGHTCLVDAPHMILERIGVAELLPAQIANVRKLVVVRTHVAVAVAMAAEATWAEWAWVGSLTLVDHTDVGLQ
jgi:hypothetical protein